MKTVWISSPKQVVIVSIDKEANIVEEELVPLSQQFAGQSLSKLLEYLVIDGKLEVEIFNEEETESKNV